LSVVEQTPSKLSLDIWNDKAPELLRQLLAAPALDAKARAALEPIVAARQDIGRIDTELEGLSAQQDQLDERANQERENLLAIQKDPKAAALRKRLGQRLEELTQKAAELGRKIVELNSQRMERKIDLEDKMRDLDLTTAL
jgi:chromosome segregation ATPase